MERLRAAGHDVAIVAYPHAYHAFDNHRLSASLRLGQAMNPSACHFEERTRGEVVNTETGKAPTFREPCWTRGATVGYEPGAHAAARAAVRELLQETFSLAC